LKFHKKAFKNSNDKKLSHLHCVWAIKPDCSFINIEPKPGENNIFDYKILNDEQLNFDFIEIILIKQQDGEFICDKKNNMTRKLDKAIY